MADASYIQQSPRLRGQFGNRLQARLIGLSRPRTRLIAEPEPRLIGSPMRGARLLAGQFWFEGEMVEAPGGSPWRLTGDQPFLDALHGFMWLDDLAAAPDRDAPQRAREWTQEWIKRFGRGKGHGWTPALAGRRLIRWVSHAHALRGEGAEEARFVRALARHTRFLSRRWYSAPAGLPRIEALSALTFGALTLQGMEHLMAPAIAALGQEAAACVDEHGAIASRNPEELLDVFFHLILSATALAEGTFEPGEAHLSAIARIAPVLRALRHANGGLARFHGGGRGEEGRLDQALAVSGVRGRAEGLAMGYARLAAGRSTVIVDAAPPVSGPLSAHAHASTLAFELTSGRRPVIVSCGSGDGFGGEWRRAGRATPSHSTLGVEGMSSSRLSAAPDKADLLEEVPSTVTCSEEADPAGKGLTLSHDGWRGTHGLIHVRQLSLSQDGRILAGEDTLGAITDADKAAFDDVLEATEWPGIRFSIRFHLHPEAKAFVDEDGASVTVSLRSGERWVFRYDGRAVMALQPSVYLDKRRLMAQATKQIVLSATVTDYAAQIGWTLAKAQDRPHHIRDLEPDDLLADA